MIKKTLNDEAKKYICLNMVSNIIGVGNAATINGIKAMKKMQEDNIDRTKPSNNMATFVLLNTASLQLIPTSMIGIRAMYMSENPRVYNNSGNISYACRAYCRTRFYKNIK